MQQDQKDLIAKKAKERAPRVPKSQMVGWTDEEVELLGDRLAVLEPVVLELQGQAAVRIRSAGTTAKRATVGILDQAGQWIPRDAETREWPTAIAALQAAGLTVDEDGVLVAYTAPPAPAKDAPAKGRGRAAAAEA